MSAAVLMWDLALNLDCVKIVDKCYVKEEREERGDC